jgi:hypothetical protein
MLPKSNTITAGLIYITIAISAVIFVTGACSYSEPVKITRPDPKPQNAVPQTTQPPADLTAPAAADNTTSEQGSWQGLVTFSGKDSTATPAVFVSSKKWRVSWTIESGMPQYASFNLFVRKASTNFSAGTDGFQTGKELHGSIPVDGSPDSYYIQIVAANLDKWNVNVEYDERYVPGSPVQIALIRFKGTPNPLGCCNPNLYEADEYVVIKNFSNISQDIRGWTLKNITRGYPSFTFPQYFPCIPFTVEDPLKYTSYTPPTVTRQFTSQEEAESEQPALAPLKIDWATCTPSTPLDEKPMKPVTADQGMPLPCILYPGQTVLVFTDQIHCFYGGFSFNFGQGNIWDNNKPDTAILYDSQGREMSRRSYSAD